MTLEHQGFGSWHPCARITVTWEQNLYRSILLDGPRILRTPWNRQRWKAQQPGPFLPTLKAINEPHHALTFCLPRIWTWNKRKNRWLRLQRQRLMAWAESGRWVNSFSEERRRLERGREKYDKRPDSCSQPQNQLGAQWVTVIPSRGANGTE